METQVEAQDVKHIPDNRATVPVKRGNGPRVFFPSVFPPLLPCRVAPSLLLPTEPHREKAREAPPFKAKQLGSFSLRFTGVDSFQQLLQTFRNDTLKSELGAHQSFTGPSLGAACWECHHLPRAVSQSSRLLVSSGM